MGMKFNIEAALGLYYSQNELSNNDIAAIFGCSRSYVNTLKKQVQQKMAEENAHPPVFDAKHLNTEYAFKVWGLDIADLERKYKKLVKFRELSGAEAPAAATA